MEPPHDRSALLTALTTEHFALQSTRSTTVTESLGRTTIYLGTLSATLVALALVARGEGSASDFRLFALVILPGLVFLGTVTFVRVLETGIEDAICAQAINRIRHFYIELAGEDARYFALSGNDDMTGGLANMGITYSPWRPLLSVASVIALVNGIVVGAMVGIAIEAVASRAVAVPAGVVATMVTVAVHYRYGTRRFGGTMASRAPLFPSEPLSS